jgi:hypothetical protein
MASANKQNNMPIVSFRLRLEEVELLHELARETHLSKNKIIRCLLQQATPEQVLAGIVHLKGPDPDYYKSRLVERIMNRLQEAQ